VSELRHDGVLRSWGELGRPQLVQQHLGVEPSWPLEERLGPARRSTDPGGGRSRARARCRPGRYGTPTRSPRRPACRSRRGRNRARALPPWPAPSYRDRRRRSGRDRCAPVEGERPLRSRRCSGRRGGGSRPPTARPPGPRPSLGRRGRRRSPRRLGRSRWPARGRSPSGARGDTDLRMDGGLAHGILPFSTIRRTV
jgi:hypothetical protein